MKIDVHAGRIGQTSAVAARVTHATGTAEREAALEMAQALPASATHGADKGYDAEAFVEDLKTRKIGQLKLRGIEKVGTVFTLALAAYNIVRLSKLIAAAGELCPDAAR